MVYCPKSCLVADVGVAAADPVVWVPAAAAAARAADPEACVEALAVLGDMGAGGTTAAFAAPPVKKLMSEPS